MTRIRISRSIGAVIVLFAVAGIAALIASNTAQGQPSTSNPTRPVEVVNLPSNPVPVAGTVAVSNLGNIPLPVRDVDSRARRPFQFATSCSTTTSGGCLASYGVPNDKRAVIEYVSADTFLGSSGAALRVAFTTQIGGNRVTHHLPLAEKLGGHASLGETVRLYSDPGTVITFFGERLGSSDGETIFFTISGYLADPE